jgi:hypothetical protein
MATAHRLPEFEPTYLEELLEHLTKLEFILASNVIEWATAHTGNAYARLGGLADEMVRIDSQRRDRP